MEVFKLSSSFQLLPAMASAYGRSGTLICQGGVLLPSTTIASSGKGLEEITIDILLEIERLQSAVLDESDLLIGSSLGTLRTLLFRLSSLPIVSLRDRELRDIALERLLQAFGDEGDDHKTVIERLSGNPKMLAST